MSDPTETLINEVRLLYQSLVQIGERLHAGSQVSLGMRAVLEFLERNGPATVPTMARARRVTRQRIQTLVNALLGQALVETVTNPASRRSPLIRLTQRGAKTIRTMRQRETAKLAAPIGSDDLQQATRTLAALRLALEEEGR
jgi:DNA-binding MarR family transcriptional regulator